MTIWHVLLYAGAAFLALRSFIQLATNYRYEFEQETVTEHLTKFKEEIESASPVTETPAGVDEAIATGS